MAIRSTVDVETCSPEDVKAVLAALLEHLNLRAVKEVGQYRNSPDLQYTLFQIEKE